MKNLFVAILAGTLILGSCSKESKINKKLDGSWTLTEENDAAVTNGTTVLTFNKDKKEGMGTVEFTDGTGQTTTTEFTYVLDKNILTTSNNSYTVLEYTKENLSLLSTNGTFELKQDFTRK